MKITIGIPVRNGERYLGDAIASALAQSRPADEVLVVDDASEDATAGIARSSKWAGRVRYVLNECPTGWANAFTRVYQLSKCDYAVILCADDLLDSECLAVLERSLTTFAWARLAYVGCRYVDTRGSVIDASPEPHCKDAVVLDGEAYVANWLQGVRTNRLIHRCAGVAIQNRLVVDQCEFRREAGLIADTDFFVRAGALTAVVGVSQPFATVRLHGGSISASYESLVLRLAEDYMFQVRQYGGRGSVRGGAPATVFHEMAARMIAQLMTESICRGRPEWLQKALSWREEFDAVVPGYRPPRMRWIQDATWRFAEGRMRGAVALLAASRASGFVRAVRRKVLGIGGQRRAMRK